MTYTRETADLEACPACGSRRIACVGVVERLRLDFCTACLKAWERLAPGVPHLVDGEMLAFDIPCDNCAFRGKSAEREDRDRWDELQQILAHGGQFYCHKGVAFDPRVGDGESARGFEFPLKTATTDLAGGCAPHEVYDVTRMRLCRGYLNRYIGGIARERP